MSTATPRDVRCGRSIDDVIARARPGDIVVVDAMDLEPERARALIAADVCAVVNAAPSLSGRFPTGGPLLLVRAGIVLIDGVGGAADGVVDGERLVVLEDSLQRRGEVVAQGVRRRDAELAAELDEVRRAGGVLVRADAMLADTVTLLRSEPAVVDAGDADPALVRRLSGRACVVVPAESWADQDNLVRRAAATPGWAVVAAGTAARDALIDRGVVADVVIIPAGSPGQRDDDPDSDAGQTLESAATINGPALDAALIAVLTAGARVAVPVGRAAQDLIEALDQPRDRVAVSALTRLVGAGRIIDPDTLAALQADPLPRGTGRRVHRDNAAASRGRLVALVAGAIAGLVVAAAIAWPLGRSSQDSEAAALRAQVDSAASLVELGQIEGAQDQAFLGALEPTLVADRLDGRRLVLVVAPGADPALVDGVRLVVERAGGTWSGTVQLEPEFLDPAQAARLDDLALRLAPAGTDLPEDGPPGARRDAAFAASLLVPAGEPNERSEQAAGFLTAASQLGALSISGEPAERASLAVVLTPGGAGPSATEAEADGASQPIDGVVSALGTRAGVAAVVPGDGRPGSVVERLRSADEDPERVATVDGVERTLGRLSLVEAAAAAFDGRFISVGPFSVPPAP